MSGVWIIAVFGGALLWRIGDAMYEVANAVRNARVEVKWNPAVTVNHTHFRNMEN